MLDYRLSREQILQRLETDAQETIRAALIDMESWLDGVESSTLFLARILEQRDYSHEGLAQMLKDIVENNDDIYGSTIALNPEIADSPRGFAPYYFHREGILSYADLASEEYAYQQQAWYTDAVNAGTPVWVEPYFDHGGGEILMTTYSVPVFRLDAQGQRFLYAVVTADVALDELQAYLRRLRLGDSGFATLLSRTGIILSSRNPEYIMQHYSDVRSDTVDLPTWRDMFQSVLEGQAVTRRLECPELAGACIIRMDDLQSTGWPVGVVYSEREITAPLREFQTRAAALGFITLALMALAVYVVTRRLTRPLTMLARASDNIAQGKLDASLPPAKGNDEVARLVRSFGAMKTDLKKYIADLETATASRSRLEGELAAAREIQMSLLPRGAEALEKTSQYTLWARVRPAKSVGGDLYYYQQSGQHLYIAVGDVSDKGVPAALFMAKATSLIQQLLASGDSPVTVMAALNDALEEGNDNCMFVTLFLGVLDLENLQLDFASAGHCPPSRLRGGNVEALSQADGPALGLAPGLEFPANSIQLQEGDRLAIYTDGIDEAFNADAEMFGVERFNRALASTSELALAEAGPALFRAVDDHAGATPQSDDITLLLLGMETIRAQPRDTLPATPIEQSFAPGERLAGRVMDWLQAALDDWELPMATGMELVLVAEEICTNIEKYAELPSDSAITVSLQDSGTALGIEFASPGKAFNPLEDARRSPLGADIESAEIGGLGVHLITQLTDQQSYRHEGGYNILRVEKQRPADSE
jgi:sigma-B regulation protein RsbU (phosphoserine phosphatase)